MSYSDSQARQSIDTMLVERKRLLGMLLRKIYLLGGFILFVALVLGALVQRAQRELKAEVKRHFNYTVTMCENRRANTIKTNGNWDKLAAMERHNQFIDDALRDERLKIYEEAKLVVPICDVKL